MGAPDFPGPFSPEAIARGQAYYGGAPDAGPQMSAAPAGPPAPVSSPVGAPPPPGAPLPPAGPPPPPPTAQPGQVESKVSDYWGSSQGERQAPTFIDDPSSGRFSKAPGQGAAVGEIGPPVASEGYASWLRDHPKPGGAPGNPDPFGIKAATKGYLGTFDTEKEGMRAGSEGERAKNLVMAQRHADLAQQQREDAALDHAAAEEQQRHFDESMQKAQGQLDAIRERKVDPLKGMHGEGFGVLAVIGGALGGLYQGLNHLQSNPFLDDLHKQMDRTIALQEKEIDRDRTGVLDKINVLGQQRTAFKDAQLAKLQYRNTIYEATKQGLEAEGARYDDPIIKARADVAISAVDRVQKQTQLEIAKQAQAQAAAAAAQARAQAQQQFENRLKLMGVINEGTKAQAELVKAGAEGTQKQDALFVPTGKDPATGQPTGYMAHTPEEAVERSSSRQGAQKLLDLIDRVQEIRSEQGVLGRTLNRETPGIGLRTPEWQNQLRTLHADMLPAWVEAKGIKRLSKEDLNLGDDALKDLDSYGAGADERLNELRKTLQKGLQEDEEAPGGAQVTKGARGYSGFSGTGASNAPANQRGSQGVDREAP